MRYEHIARAFFGQPWALELSKMHAIADLVRLRANGGHVSAEEIAAVVGAARQPAPRSSQGGIAVIPVYGVISPRASLMTESSGGTSAEAVGQMLSAALADPAVGSILMEFDSPGGSVTGMTELAAKIRAVGAQKPVTAHVNSLAASAAYWLASQAGEVVVTPSGMVGSVGVYTEHADISRALDAEGVTPTIISAGKYKVEGNPYAPLSDDARANLQKMVDDAYATFTADVAKGRGVSTTAVRNGFGEGRVVSAKDAGALGMVDRIATFDDTIARLAGRPRQAVGTRTAAEVFGIDAETLANVSASFDAQLERAGISDAQLSQPDEADRAAADIDIRRRRLALLGGS